MAAAGGHAECVTLLLEKSDEDAEDGEGNTPLWAAAAGGHMAAASALVAGGADANLACEGGATPLHAAAGEGSSEMVRPGGCGHGWEVVAACVDCGLFGFWPCNGSVVQHSYILNTYLKPQVGATSAVEPVCLLNQAVHPLVPRYCMPI